MNILIPILLFTLLGLLAGILLTVASRFFAVETDPRQERITEALPGANCGGCGFAGCADYAEAVAQGKAEPNLCRPGGAETAHKIGAILGKEVQTAAPMVMTVHCNGDCNVSRPFFNFTGIQTCAAAKAFYSGDGLCRYGCLGLGDCAAVCDDNAICIVNGLAHIHSTRCIACGKCAAVCPNGLLSLRPANNPVTVSCSSCNNGKDTKTACDNGCIGCRMCVKSCPNGAITVTNFHAVIDYEKCTGCGTCTKVCPTKAVRCI